MLLLSANFNQVPLSIVKQFLMKLLVVVFPNVAKKENDHDGSSHLWPLVINRELSSVIYYVQLNGMTDCTVLPMYTRPLNRYQTAWRVFFSSDDVGFERTANLISLNYHQLP